MSELRTGITDKYIIKDDTSTDITSEVGHGSQVEYSISNESTAENSLNTGTNQAYVRDNRLVLGVNYTCRSSGFEPLKLLGNESANTINFGETRPPIYSFEVQDQTDTTLTFTNVVFEQCEITIESDGEISYTFSGSAGDYTRNESTSLSTGGVPSSVPLHTKDMVLDIDGSVVGVPVSANFTISTGGTQVYSWGSAKPVDVKKTSTIGTGTITVRLKDGELITLFVDGGGQPSLNRSPTEVLLGNNRNGETITFNNALLSNRDTSHDRDNEDDREVTSDFVCESVEVGL